VRRFSWNQQHEVARWIESKVAPLSAPGRDRDVVRVAIPNDPMDYFRLRQPLARAGLTPIYLRNGHWFDSAPEVVVVPEWYAIGIRRAGFPARVLRDLERLQSGAAGYREAGRWRSTYLQEDFYTWLDPGFAADLWQGEIGFAVYVREDLSTAPAITSAR
jgi:hypothetical protein